jgi:large subunit ribosomal protein L10
MPALEFKAGVIGSVLYDAQGVVAIANIPSREELLGRLLGSLKSPVATFARLISQIAESKGDDTTPEPVTEEPVTETPVEKPAAEAAAEEPAAAEPAAEAVVEEPAAEKPAE